MRSLVKRNTQKYEFKKILTTPSFEKSVAFFWADVADVMGKVEIGSLFPRSPGRLQVHSLILGRYFLKRRQTSPFFDKIHIQD